MTQISDEFGVLDRFLAGDEGTVLLMVGCLNLLNCRLIRLVDLRWNDSFGRRLCAILYLLLSLLLLLK